MGLSRDERNRRIGDWGERRAATDLGTHGLTEIVDLNKTQRNHHYADISAVRDGERFFISVKARNKFRQGGVSLNEAFNLLAINNAENAKRRSEGMTKADITRMLFVELAASGEKWGGTPAWVMVPFVAKAQRYSAYFGVASEYASRRDVPMTPVACGRYECLADNQLDTEISPDWFNA